MKWSIGIRALVYLRQIARAMESIAISQRDLATIERGRYEVEHPVRRKVTTDFGTLDIAEANKRWKADRVAQGIIDEDDGE